ncbi:MAG: helix-turn-helix domain-containing protein [Paraclostridium sp.]|uniref:helix-turn-helix domain-containing protein n=1 Tax=Paraclostridium sp. TaxID=2023273 RepID=UPI003EE762E4
MKNLIEFFENQLGKKINLYKYNKNDILKENHQIVVWDNQKYVIELIEEDNINNLKGNFYLIYQKNVNKTLLNEILTTLYEDVNIVNYKGNFILNTENVDLINKDTPQIIETESYEKTYIINLGEIKSKDEFDIKLDLIKRLKKYIAIENSDRKYFDIFDLALYNMIELCGTDIIYKKLFDYNLIDKVDNLVLETGIAFIETGFNISKTSNKIYLHRNTLIYRLEKIKDVLGMDIKNFNEACIYYIIVKNYLVNKTI